MDKKIQAVRALHNEAALTLPMVYEVWEDGEVTLTKGGDLYGRRSLHTDMPGIPEKALPWDSLPLITGKHSRIACMTREDVEKARAIILGE